LHDFRNERLLVIAPHSDDEVLGCGGLIAKIKSDGGKVFVLIFNVGSVSEVDNKKATKKWKKETEKAMKFLKVDEYDTVFDSPKDNRFLDSKPLHDIIKIIETKSKVSIDKIKPNIVAIPTNHSHHQDHIQVFNASIAALRPMRTPMPKIVLSYEAPEHSRWSSNGSFEPNFFVDIKDFLSKKIQAFYMYKSQVRIGHRDRNTIRAQAEYRGKEAGISLCESYQIHRWLE
jgi:LmbE family N-acetylglucosaminyl deacetylase